MRTLSFLTVLFVLFACESKIRRTPPPSDLLEQKKMVRITKKLVLLESHIELSYTQLDRFYKILNASSNQIFKSEGVSKKRYIRSFDYYAANPDKMKILYQIVLDELNIDSANYQ